MAFDFIKYSVDAIKIIDEIRSNGADPQSSDTVPSKPSESRINAFYRAIGLPAFFKQSEDDKRDVKDRAEKAGIANVFSEEANKLVLEADARNSQFINQLTEEEQGKFLDDFNGTVLDSIRNRKKGTLFPLIVTGQYNIFPQQRRVGGAFLSDAQLTKNNQKYRRPLIESVVLLRLRKDGLVDSTKKEGLENSFKDLQDAGFFEGQEENIFTLAILNELIRAINDPDILLKMSDKTIKDLNSIRTKLQDFPKDSVLQQSPTQQRNLGSAEKSGTLQALEDQRHSLARENEAKLTILEYDDITGNKTKNIKDSILSPMIIDLMLNDTDKIEKEIKDTNIREEKAKKSLKQLHRNLDMLSGVFSGISGIDILVIITALFTIKIEDLLGLLNKDSRERLKALRGGAELGSVSSVFDSLAALEDKVREQLDIVKSKIDVADHIERGLKEQKSNKEGQ